MSSSEVSAGEQSLSQAGNCRVTVRPPTSGWIASVVLLLLIELCLLTAVAEFSRGRMSYLASPRVATFVLMTAVLTLVICGGELRQVGRAGNRARWFFLTTNVVIFALFFLWTDWLAGAGLHIGNALASTWAWPLGGLLVGATALLICFSFRGLVAWLRDHWHHVAAAAIISVTFVMYIHGIQRLWGVTSSSTAGIAQTVLQPFQQGDVRRYQIDPYNVLLGRLRVTQYCAEMESLVAFWVVGLTMLAAYWRSSRWIRMLAVLIVGTGLMYLINGLRLAAIVGAAELTTDAQLAVHLAHSRISGVLFLALSVLLLRVTRRWWRRSEAPTSTVAEA